MADIPVHYIWLAAGVLGLLAEAMGVSGVGLLFAGIGAVTTGILIAAGQVGLEGLAQWVAFFIATAVWTALLWLPLKKAHSKARAGYSNIVGDTAFAGSNGISKEAGEATWSGTIMQAKLAEDCTATRVEAGTQVVITAVIGTTLIVKPKA